MGGRLSRGEAVPQNSGPRANTPYKYPPADGGKYFASSFHLGHRKFQSGEPEVFLFGELNDLNFLASKPVTFPYKQPTKSQPIKCLQSYINLQRDSVKLVKVEGSNTDYHLEFTFDSDVDCCFTIYNFLPDIADLALLKNGPYSHPGTKISASFHHSSGSEQQFSEGSYTIAPGDLDEDQLSYDPENGQDRFPIAILMESDGIDDTHYQCQLTVCTLDKFGDNGYTIKVLKQKLWAEGVEYLLQEIYGIENKSRSHEEAGEEEGGEEGDNDSDDEEEEDLGAECVICITDVKDTMLLPCRHLCLCSSCAGNLRYQSSNCPICRAPFQALLQIQALQPLESDEEIDDDEATGDPKYSIPGFRCIPLLKALNGYTALEDTDNINTAQNLSDESEEDERDQADAEDVVAQEHQPQTTEFCVVIPIEDDEEDNEISLLPPPPNRHPATSTKKPSTDRGRAYKIDEGSIPLPGTPTSDDGIVQVKSPHSSSSPNPLHSSIVAVSMTEDVPLQTAVVYHDPDSPCGSSVSSEQSVKSTDMLLPFGERKQVKEAVTRIVT